MSVPEEDGNSSTPELAITGQVGPVAIVPIWVLTIGLTGGEIAVYVALRSFCDRNGDCFPTARTIATRAEANVGATRNAIQKFRRLGLLTTDEVYRKNSRELAYLRYHLVDLDPRKWKVEPRGGVPRTSDTPTPVNGHPLHQSMDTPTPADVPKELTKELTKEELLKDFSSSDASLPDDGLFPTAVTPTERTPKNPAGFDEFWRLYPRKVGKIAARKAFAKAVKLAPLPVILDSVRLYAMDARMRDPEFVAHPSTWLNEGRWDDEPTPVVASPLTALQGGIEAPNPRMGVSGRGRGSTKDERVAVALGLVAKYEALEQQKQGASIVVAGELA